MTKLRAWINNKRFHWGIRITGHDALMYIAALQLTRERALATVSADGQVDPAQVKQLAEILYYQIPGNYKVTVCRNLVDKLANTP